MTDTMRDDVTSDLMILSRLKSDQWSIWISARKGGRTVAASTVTGLAKEVERLEAADDRRAAKDKKKPPNRRHDDSV
jgi:hypothetical protein